MIGVLDLSAEFFKSVLAPIVLTDGNKAGVQCLGGGVPANFVVNVGAGGGSANITIEQSDDNVTYSAVNDTAGNPISFALVAGSAGTAYIKNGFRNKPYVRAKVASTSGTIIAGVTVIEGNVYTNPSGLAAGAQTSYDAS